MPDFDAMFENATSLVPYPYQRHLATAEVFPHLVNIPTGLGKTAAVVLGWLWRRRFASPTIRQQTPRRLVYCLPMRTLVEQTEQNVRKWLDSLGLLAAHPGDTAPLAGWAQAQGDQGQRIAVSLLMGGEDSTDWAYWPEHDAVLIGTQDMLLSRALNRGYGSYRARWPMEFGLLNQDALWIMDEVQLMDVGLATSAQLQAFRDQDRAKGLRPCHTCWMSATLQPDWLRSVDTAAYHAKWVGNLHEIPEKQRTGESWDTSKMLALDAVGLGQKDDKAFVQRILTEHAEAPVGEHGRITLVVCNTVDRACNTYDALRKAGRTSGIELVHSRFRPPEREVWRERFLCREACTADADRIIVATQVVEAGVDTSASCLITELAPWANLVQRFGRCARYGGVGRVVVIDRGRNEKAVAPYGVDELNSAWDALQGLADVGIASLNIYERSLSPDARSHLYPYAPSHLLLRREFDELFDTTPDLTGADLDISRFIRSGDERDLQVFWLELKQGEEPSPQRLPQRQELCSIPFLKARDWLCGEETKSNRKPKLRDGMRAWTWDWIDGKWDKEVNRSTLLPGRIICVAAACGGYSLDRGFAPASRALVPMIPQREIPAYVQAADQADNQQDSESLSVSQWKTIACHGSEVAEVAGAIADSVSLPDELRNVLTLAGYWHDLGKAHPAFQGALRAADRPPRIDLAKGPDNAWLRPPGNYRFPDNSDLRPGFRHELASTLGLFAILEIHAPQHPALLGDWSEILTALGRQPTIREPLASPTPCVQPILDCSADSFNLLTYLVASHHGKVRVALHASPKDQAYKIKEGDGRGLPIHGVREEDRLPAVAVVPAAEPLPELALTLEPAFLGLSSRTGASWRERCLVLLTRFGPASLGYLEALFRAADVRASRMNTSDPALSQEAS